MRASIDRQILGFDADYLKEMGSYWTALEIAQQPQVWRDSLARVERESAGIRAATVLDGTTRRLVLAGAGSSALIGATLQPWLSRQLRRRVDVLPTTDIVANPEACFAEDLPTLLVSFARSGDSPESVAAMDLADQALSDCRHLIYSCNPDGELARRARDNHKIQCVMMPETAHDRSFAMTSSFTSMLLACALSFCPRPDALLAASAAAGQLIAGSAERLEPLLARTTRRCVFLGTGSLLGIAREAALKTLELTAGHTATLAESPLGFRHGPKSIVDLETLIFHMHSPCAYSRRYDEDLHAELVGDFGLEHLVPLSPDHLGFSGETLDDFWIGLPYLVFQQIFALRCAMQLGVAADNPCPTGEVNRVVQGVTIHPWAAESGPRRTSPENAQGQ